MITHYGSCSVCCHIALKKWFPTRLRTPLVKIQTFHSRVQMSPNNIFPCGFILKATSVGIYLTCHFMNFLIFKWNATSDSVSVNLILDTIRYFQRFFLELSKVIGMWRESCTKGKDLQSHWKERTELQTELICSDKKTSLSPCKAICLFLFSISAFANHKESTGSNKLTHKCIWKINTVQYIPLYHS